MSKEIATQSNLRKELQALLGTDCKTGKKSAGETVSGHAPKQRSHFTVTYRCAVTGKPFIGIYKKLSSQLYVLEKIENAQGGAGAKGGSAPPSSFPVDLKKIRDRDWHCPWCRKAGRENKFSFIRCGNCDEYICGGQSSIDKNGDRKFRCHEACGNEGYITGRIRQLDGTSSVPNRAAPSGRAASKKPEILITNESFLRIGKKP